VGKQFLWARLVVFGGCIVGSVAVLRYYTLIVDGQGKIIPWFTPNTNACDNCLNIKRLQPSPSERVPYETSGLVRILLPYYFI